MRLFSLTVYHLQLSDLTSSHIVSLVFQTFHLPSKWMDCLLHLPCIGCMLYFHILYLSFIASRAVGFVLYRPLVIRKLVIQALDGGLFFSYCVMAVLIPSISDVRHFLQMPGIITIYLRTKLIDLIPQRVSKLLLALLLTFQPLVYSA